MFVRPRSSEKNDWLNHRLSHNVEFQGSYTWSHVLDYNENNTTFSNSSSVLDPLDFHAEYGNGNQNVPNRFIATCCDRFALEGKGLGEAASSTGMSSHQASPGRTGQDYSASLSGSNAGLVSSGSSTGYVTGTSSGYRRRTQRRT